YHQLKVLAASPIGLIQRALVEDPLGLRIEQRDEGFPCDFAIEPQVDAGDGRDLELSELIQQWIPGAKFNWQQFTQSVLRDGQDHGIRRLLPAPIELDRGRSARLQTQAARRRAENDFAALFFDGRAAAVVELGQRYLRDAHAVASAVFEKGFPENVDAEARVGTIELFVEGADHDHAPETLYSARRLPGAPEPRLHGHRFAGVSVLRPAARKKNGGQGAGDGHLVFPGKRGERKKRPGHVQRGRQKSGLHHSGALLWIEKKQTIE